MKHSAVGRAAIALGTVGAMTLALVGCTPGGGGATELDTTAPVTLTWWTGQTAESEAILEKLAGEFHDLHPNVTIKISSGAPTTDDLLQKISAGFISGDYPDISYAYGSWAGELDSSGRMLDITKKVADPSVAWDQIPESGRETATQNGKVIGFPALIDNLSLLYNKTLFDAAGLDYPTNDWSWDDFRATAKALTDPATQTFGFGYPVADVEDNTWRLWPLLWQKGGDIVDSSGTKAAFDSQAGIEALDFLRSMAVDDQSVYLDQTNEKFEPLFISGSIGMIIDGPWLLSDLLIGETDYGVSFLPGFDGNHMSISGPDIWALFDHQDVNRAHWTYELMKWITDPEQDARYNLALGNLPLRPAAEQDMPEFKTVGDQYVGYDVIVENFKNIQKIRPTSAGYPALSSAVATAIAKVLQGQATSEDALKEAAEQANKALAKG